MNPLAVSACALFALALPSFSQALSWETTGPQDNQDPGNSLVFANGEHGFTVTSWGYTAGKKNTAFEAAAGIVYPTGIGVTSAGERPRVPEHQLDNAKGNEWVLIVFDSLVTDVSLVVDPYGTWDRDVTYYTANLSGPVSLAGLSYSDLGELGFGERVDDLSTRSNQSREVEISGTGSFNAILVGAQQGAPGGFRNVDRFKITGVEGSIMPVPEPSSAMLGLLGGLFLLRRSR